MPQTDVKLRPSSRKELLRDLGQAVAEIRQEAREKGLDKMTKHEIQATVAAARRDPKKPRKPTVK